MKFKLLRKILSPPVFDNKEKTRLAGLFNGIAISGFLILTTSIVLRFATGTMNVRQFWIAFTLDIVLLILLAIIRRGYVRAACLLFSVMLFVGVSFAVYINGGASSSIASYYILFIVTTSLLVSNRAGIVSMIFSIIAVLGFVQADNAGLIPYAKMESGTAHLLVYSTVFSAVAAVQMMAVNSIKRALEATRRSERNLRKAQEVAHLGSWIWHTGTNEMEMSDELYKIIGMIKEDGVPPIDIEAKMVHPDDRELLTTNITRCIREKKPYSLDYRIHRQDDGEIRYLHVETEIEEIPGSEDIIIHGTVQDITERKQAEENLRKTARDLQEAQRIGNLGSWSNNAATGEINWSDQVYRIFGYEPDTGLSPTEIFDRHIHPDDKEVYWGMIKSNFENPEIMDFKDIPLRIISPTGETKYSTTSGEYFKGPNGEKMGARGTILDITERRITEMQLQKYSAELARSNEELQQFAYIASHDLREPLRKIQAFGGRLSSKYADELDARGQDFIARMQDAAARGLIMVEALLSYSRVTTRGEPFVQTDLNQVINDVLSDLEIRIENSQGRVTVDEMPTINVDPTQMRQLFQNLISNALKFHAPDQSPVVEVTGSTLSSSESSPDQAQISVKDQGIGFDEAFIDRIFQPFQRLHSRMEYEGSGIGLAVCRKIVERHGGDISAQSKSGEGAVFTVTLPVEPMGSDQ